MSVVKHSTASKMVPMPSQMLTTKILLAGVMREVEVGAAGGVMVLSHGGRVGGDVGLDHGGTQCEEGRAQGGATLEQAATFGCNPVQ